MHDAYVIYVRFNIFRISQFYKKSIKSMAQKS